MERLKENPDIEQPLKWLVARYPNENSNQILYFFDLCVQHWKRSRTYVLEKYQDAEKFPADFSTWKSKQKSNF